MFKLLYKRRSPYAVKLFQKIVRIGDVKYLTALKLFSMLETLNQGSRLLGCVLERREAIKIFLGISGKKIHAFNHRFIESYFIVIALLSDKLFRYFSKIKYR